MTTILDRIVEAKRKEVAAARSAQPMAALEAAAKQAEPPRDFFSAVTAASPTGIQLIAEIKRASPSAGVIVDDFDPVQIARAYHSHGAVAISVLTDEAFFQGQSEHIGMVKEAVPLPVLRKDFIIDEYQLYQSRAAGADAVLLIVEILGVDLVRSLWRISHDLAMATLVEVHTSENLSAVLNCLGPPGSEGYILGINNRDLAAQRTDLTTTGRLAAQLPSSAPFVAESGIATRRDVLEVQQAGACAILVGESLLRAQDIGAQIDVMLGR